MTEPLALRSYREEFTRRAERQREELRRDIDHMRREEKKRDEREARDEANSDLDALALTVLASPPEIAAFSVTLDSYDTATIEALMDNDEALKLVREELRIMMDKAYMLPDGR